MLLVECDGVIFNWSDVGCGEINFVVCNGS